MLNKAKVLMTVIFVGSFLAVPALAVLLQSDAELAEAMPEGEGRGTVRSVCTTCHTLGMVLTQRRSKEEWEQSVNEMIGRGAQIFPDEMEGIVSYLGEHYGPEATGSASSASPGRGLLQDKCFQCHGDTMWRDLKQNRRSWEGTLYRMVGRGALWTEEEISSMAEYLASEYGPE
ncbi:hypothetical protein MYX82_09180 [Acidobacteria bacterium AH-259-D05]|nr:hypothetical protein [Acidobacteria bacterium AH-259-D05]